MMRKICVILFLLFVAGILSGCGATPANLREDGPAFIFTVPKGTPQEFSRCLVGQLDDKFFNGILRDHPDGNTTVLIKDSDQLETRIMFDIDKTINGLNILVYFSWCSGEICDRNNLVFPTIVEVLNACGAKEVKR